VQLSAQYRLFSSIKDQIENLLAGFYEIIPKDLVTIVSDLSAHIISRDHLLICLRSSTNKNWSFSFSGTPDIDVDEWRSATEYNGYTSSDPVIVLVVASTQIFRP